jgi:aminopeptidase N
MKKILFLTICLLTLITLNAQTGSPKSEALKIYRGTADRINDLVHTKLDAKFDYQKSQLNGKV